jgi:hypothetical protein
MGPLSKCTSNWREEWGSHDRDSSSERPVSSTYQTTHIRHIGKIEIGT